MIIKFLKSLFSIPDESKTKLSKKTMHSAPARGDSVQALREKSEQATRFVDKENEITRIKSELTELSGTDEKEVVALAKSKQITGTPLTQAEIEYIAGACDFTLRDGKPDPRVLEVINFAVNLHAVKVHGAVGDILKKFDQQ